MSQLYISLALISLSISDAFVNSLSTRKKPVDIFIYIVFLWLFDANNWFFFFK